MMKVQMKTIKLSQKESKLLLGLYDTSKYDMYHDMFEFVDDNELERIEKKLLSVISKEPS